MACDAPGLTRASGSLACGTVPCHSLDPASGWLCQQTIVWGTGWMFWPIHVEKPPPKKKLPVAGSQSPVGALAAYLVLATGYWRLC